VTGASYEDDKGKLVEKKVEIREFKRPYSDGKTGFLVHMIDYFFGSDRVIFQNLSYHLNKVNGHTFLKKTPLGTKMYSELEETQLKGINLGTLKFFETYFFTNTLRHTVNAIGIELQFLSLKIVSISATMKIVVAVTGLSYALYMRIRTILFHLITDPDQLFESSLLFETFGILMFWSLVRIHAEWGLLNHHTYLIWLIYLINTAVWGLIALTLPVEASKAAVARDLACWNYVYF